MTNSYNNAYNNSADKFSSGWFNKWYNRIADNFPTFGISAASRNDVINGEVPKEKRLFSFAIAALTILTLVLLLIVPAVVLGPGLFAAGGMSAIAPIITGGVGLLGAAAYFGIKSYQNAKSLKRNLDLADKRDQIIEANQKYSNLDQYNKIDKDKQIKNGTFKNNVITEKTLNKILTKAAAKFPDSSNSYSRLQKIYIGAQLLKCYTSDNITEENKKSLKKINIADKFNEVFALNGKTDDVKIQNKNDALLACVARNYYDTTKAKDPKEKGKLANYIEGVRDDFYGCDVSDNVVNIALNNAVGSYYEDIDNNNLIKKFYDKNQSEKFCSREKQLVGKFMKLTEPSKADLFDKEIGIQKASIFGEALGSAIATLPIATAFYNAGKSSSMIHHNNAIDDIFKSYENDKKIDSDVAGLDSSRDGTVTIAECKAYAISKGITEQQVYDWMKSYGITPPTTTSSTTVESIVMNKSLGKGFTDYINQNYPSDKSKIDPKDFEPYNIATTKYEEKTDEKTHETTKTLTISFGKPAKTIVLDESQMKRFAAATGISCTADDKDDFSKAVLAKYKVFATEIKSASIYTITKQEHDALMKSYGITAPISDSSTTVELNVIDPRDFDAYNSASTTYDKTTKTLTISFGNPAKTITLKKTEMKLFAAATGISFTKDDKDDFSQAVLAKYKLFATEIKSASITNPSGWSNYLNGLKKENGFAADSMKVASATITTTNVPAEMSKAERTKYEMFWYKTLPGMCEELRKAGSAVDKTGVKDLADSLFDSLFGFFPKQSSSFLDFLDKNMIGDGMTVDDFKTYLCGAGPGAIDYLENFSKYMHYSVQPNGATDAAKCLKNMNALLDKMCSEEPGKSYTEQFWREKFNVSVGDGSATREVEKFKQSVSNWTKTLGNGVKVANKIPFLQDLLGGEEAKETKKAYTKGEITVNWSESKTVNMLGNSVAPSQTKADLKKFSDDMKNAAIFGALGGLGAGLVGGFAVYDNKNDNKKNNQRLTVVGDEKNKRIDKDDSFDALLNKYKLDVDARAKKLNNDKKPYTSTSYQTDSDSNSQRSKTSKSIRSTSNLSNLTKREKDKISNLSQGMQM